MEMDGAKPFLVLLRGEDRDRLEMISGIFGLSKSAALRMSLVAMSRQLGFDKELPERLLKEK
jgi:hypothetical protein